MKWVYDRRLRYVLKLTVTREFQTASHPELHERTVVDVIIKIPCFVAGFAHHDVGKIKITISDAHLSGGAIFLRSLLPTSSTLNMDYQVDST